MKELVIGLGSNLGNRRENLEFAVKLIGEKIGRVLTVSTYVETEPWGFESANQFLNGVVLVADEDSANQPDLSRLEEIIRILQSIEAGFGRVRTGVYADRIIDLDILFYGDVVIEMPGLIVPHPKLQDRDFVLISLMEVCPDKMHPILKRSIRDIWYSRNEGKKGKKARGQKGKKEREKRKERKERKEG
jgi:2-amino-4-hydroxy-6-hydroxymethyldihydropteridine diphosphokinase